MTMSVILGLMIPFVGTTLGSAVVFFMKRSLSVNVSRALTGFAAGVMTAASVWSLIIPAIEQSEPMGKWSFLPAFIGFWLGVGFLLLLDHVIPHLHINEEEAEGPKSKLARTTMMVLAVTLHLCMMDYYTFEMQGAVLDRTKTLGYGDDECNFNLMSKERAKEIGFVKSPDAKGRCP